MRLTERVRPSSLRDICGQAGPKEFVRALIEDRERCPKVYVFHGEHGIGKTSMARIVALGLNCEDKPKHRPCGKCASCVDGVDNWMEEFDAASIQDWNEVRNLFYRAAVGSKYRVMVFDEFGLASKTAQASFLKVLEEVPEGVVVILTTTDLQRIIPTVRSRAVEVAFTRPSDDEVRTHLVKVINTVGLTVPEDVVEEIVGRAQGHLREAILLLDVYQGLGSPEAFARAYSDPTGAWVTFLRDTRMGVDAKEARETVQLLSEFPLPQARAALFSLVNSMLGGYAQNINVVPAGTLITIGATQERREPGSEMRDVVGAVPGPCPERGTIQGAAVGLSGGTPVPHQGATNTLPPDRKLQGTLPSAETGAANPSPVYTESESSLSLPEVPHGSIHTSITPNTNTKTSCELVPNGTTPFDPVGSSAPRALKPGLVPLYGKDCLRLLAFISSEWAMSCLSDPARFTGFLWSLFVSFRAPDKRR